MIAWPKCPECGEPIGVVDRACEIRPTEVEVFRSYGCSCGWTCWTVETVIAVRPETLYLKHKFAQPAGQTGVTPPK